MTRAQKIVEQLNKQYVIDEQLQIVLTSILARLDEIELKIDLIK